MTGLLNYVPGMGLLGGPSLDAASAPGPGGLLGAFRPAEGESLSRRIFGDPRNPLDPRGTAMTALAAGLLRGDLAGALEGASRAPGQVQDAFMRRAGGSMELQRGAMELEAMQAAARRNAAIQSEIARLQGGGSGMPSAQPMPGGAGGFDTPSMGGVPMFSMGSQPRSNVIGAPGGPNTPNAGLPSPTEVQSYGASGGGAGLGAAGMPGAGGMGGAGGPNTMQQLLALADIYMRNGDVKSANELYQRAAQFRSKFEAPQLMKDPASGRLVYVRPSDDGGYQVLPFGAKPDISLQDLGDRVMAIDRNEAPNGQTFGKSMTPDARASNALGWANYNNARQRLDFERGTGRAPQGYRFKQDGTLEAIPGGPADIKAGELGAKNAARTEHALGQADVVIDTINEALGKAGFLETGLTGSVVGRVPGTDAYDLRRTVETVKANIGFDNLQRMRDMSPTGGALGQVAVQELNALQSTVGNLDANQSQAVLRDNLAKVKRHYEGWQKVMRQAGGGGGGGERPAKPPMRLPSTKPGDLTAGQVYTLPNGANARWDGQKFTEVR